MEQGSSPTDRPSASTALDWAVVIPSIRTIGSELLAGIPEHIPVFVVDDSNGGIIASQPNMRVFTYDDQEKILGSNARLVPRKTAACRNFAFYFIWRETDHTGIITLDDDCYPRNGFLEQHAIVGSTGPIRTLTSASGWVNTISLLPVQELLFARGYPYWAREDNITHDAHETSGRSVCNLGLWAHHLDFDGMDKLAVERYQHAYDFDHSSVGQMRVGTPENPTKVPFSGMNVAFLREMLPVMTQIPMNQRLGLDYSLYRFDDLWAGVLIQALIDRIPGDCLTVGDPIVTHIRSGNVQREVAGEHYGHLLSPYFQEVVESVKTQVRPSSYLSMYVELCELALDRLHGLRDELKLPRMYADVLVDIFAHLVRWTRLFV